MESVSGINCHVDWYSMFSPEGLLTWARWWAQAIKAHLLCLRKLLVHLQEGWVQWGHSLLPDACKAKGLEFCKPARNGQQCGILTLRMVKTSLDVGTWEMCSRHISICRHDPHPCSLPGLWKQAGQHLPLLPIGLLKFHSTMLHFARLSLTRQMNESEPGPGGLCGAYRSLACP